MNESNQTSDGASSRRNFIAMTGMLAATGACVSGAGRSRAASDPANADKEDVAIARNVKHLVFMQFKDGVSPARIEEHKTAVVGLNGKIPVLRNIEFGADFAGRADGLTHCIIVTLGRRSDIEAYLNHPAHVPVAEALVADLARLLVMDVEFGV